MKKSIALLILIAALAGIFATNRDKRTTAKEVVRFDVFRETPLTLCTPRGWLQEFLHRQRTGLTGHPDVLSYPFNTCLWAGNITRENETHGDNWWRYEQTAYYSDGLLRLGYLLKDTALINKGREGIRYTLANQHKNGRLGPDLFPSQWPVAVYFRVLQAEYLATGDQTIIEALHKHYLSYTPGELGRFKRAIVNLEGALWTYGKTGDPQLLELAEKAYRLGGFELNMQTASSPDTLILHGVTYMEMAKLPALLYAYTGKKEYLEAALNAMYKLDRDHMLPDGVPSSNEFLAGKDPLMSHETCDISDYTWTLGYFLMITGDARWADKIERAVFNAGPGAVSKDFKSLQYFSSVNQCIATGSSNHNKHAFGKGWMAYWPCHETECCAGNVHRFMPNYAARMWMRDKEGGAVAALYGPSVEQLVPAGSKDTCVITESTAYPFSDKIRFSFDLAHPAAMPFTFRVPAWCGQATVHINGEKYTAGIVPGKYTTLHRTFKKGDVIELQLPMQARVTDYNHVGLIVERGPILFSLPIAERVKTDTQTYAYMGGKKSTDPAFPALNIRPAGPWNYALDVNEHNFTGNIEVVERAAAAYPFDPSGVPVSIKVPVCKVQNWKLKEGRFTPPLPVPGKFKMEPGAVQETITLVPYGSTRLRITVFPEALK